MTPPSVAQRWLAGLLCAAFFLDIAFNLLVGQSSALVALPGAVLVLFCAYLATYQPAPAALAGAFTVVASSVLLHEARADVMWIGIPELTLSELLGGAALVVLVVRGCRTLVAFGVTSTLVLAALTALLVRTSTGHISGAVVLRSMVFGLAVLVACVVAGVNLRDSQDRVSESGLSELVRRQWPLATALGVLLVFDLGASGGGLRFAAGSPRSLLEVLALGGAATASVCAVFAPRRPFTLALVAAAAMALAPLPLLASTWVISSPATPTIPISQVAASMALIAYLARYSPTRQAVLGASAVAVAATTSVWLREPHWLLVDARDVVALNGFLFVISVVTGLYFRARDRERTQLVSTAVTGAQQAERMALARELHDVVAHHVTGIVVHAQAAQLVDDPEVTKQSLARIEASGTEALAAMRMLVGSMRGAEPAGRSDATGQATSDLAADLRMLVDGFHGPGVSLHLDLPNRLPDEVGRSVLRVVQESLTNVGKHASGARSADVSVASTGSQLVVEVVDDGTASRNRPVGGSGGYGLVGMRERVELLGGHLDAGARDGGADGDGWRVRATLPLRRNE